MKRKIIFLSLALLLPVIVFLFLKTFGRNRFDIPVYHKDSVEFMVGCERTFEAPYVIADSVTTEIGWKGNEATLISFSEILSEGLMRLKEDFEPSQLQIVSLNESKFARLRCVFLVSEKYNAVLVDSKKQIRGYYQLTSRDEADRLLMEISILLKDY
ncbi:MAG: hypothetical protein LW721_15985 [Flammeovirgaceae bacterium]|jgi:hypothetical protein|nr:hypothetical protein [Flammeovirgaceae bacterium]